MLSVAMALHMLAAILMLMHLWRYAVNGRGIPLFETLSEGTFYCTVSTLTHKERFSVSLEGARSDGMLNSQAQIDF